MAPKSGLVQGPLDRLVLRVLKPEWKLTEQGARTKYTSLTRASRKQLESEKESWARTTGFIAQ